jgi:hypothetical protein
MMEELTNRLLKLEKELKSTKYLVLFLILMFIILAYQYITVQQKSMITVDLIRTRGLIVQDQFGNDVMLLGSPVPFTKTRKRTDPLAGLLMMDQNGRDRLFLGKEGALQVDGKLFNRIDEGWGFLVNDKNGNERGGFGILDSLNSVILGLDYPGGEAIMLVAKPKNAFILINSDTVEYPRERIVLWHENSAGENTFIKMGDKKADDRIIVRTGSNREPSLEFHKTNGTKYDLLE